MPGVRQALGAAALLPQAASLLLRRGRPGAVLYFGVAPGDDVLATAVVRQWRRVRGTKPAYLTNHPGLFENNPDVAWTAPYSPELAGALSMLGIPRRRLKYHDYDAAADRSVGPPGHFIELMCRSAGLPPMEDPIPRVFLTAEELESPGGERPRVALQSSALSAKFSIGNKDWYPERMQEVVDRLRDRAEVVQLGLASDPALKGVTDLRGKTSVRDAAIVLARSSVFVGMATFLMHLARAVDTPSVIVYGGREDPAVSGYDINRNITTAMECSHCWLWNRCPLDRECMKRISAADVAAAVDGAMARIVHREIPGHDAGANPYRPSG